MAEQQLLRIGELSKRAGVSPELLRAWERRYGLLRPIRSPGGLRLYSLEDLERVRLMHEYLAQGLAAAEAAALAARASLDAESSQPAVHPATLREELGDALDHLDEPGAQAVLDRLLAAMTVDTLLGDVVLPYLHELGDRWERGEVTIAQEHFASGVLRGRLLGLARGWGLGLGPLAVLACLPGEQHDLGLIAFGLALRARGWRVICLGADTPIETLQEAVDDVDPVIVVLSAVTAELVEPVAGRLRTVAERHRVALGGGAAHDGAAGLDSLLALNGELIASADALTALADRTGPA